MFAETLRVLTVILATVIVTVGWLSVVTTHGHFRPPAATLMLGMTVALFSLSWRSLASFHQPLAAYTVLTPIGYAITLLGVVRLFRFLDHHGGHDAS